MPPPVRTLDDWLEAYAELDVDAMAALTFPADRELLRAGVAGLDEVPRPAPSDALPDRPLDHEILDIEDKAPTRWVIGTKLQVSNPLPFTSEKVGQRLPGVPESRPLRRRFLVVETGGSWGVKLDLSRVVARAALGAELLALIAGGELRAAENRLAAGVPPVPDDGNGQPEGDRLVQELTERIARARARRGDAATSTTAAPAAD